jgi:hypothetical protein
VVDVAAAVDGEPDGEVVDGTVVGGTVVAGSEELVETLVVVLAASLSVPRFWLSEDRSSREQPETVGARPARRSQRPLLRRNVLRSIPLMAPSVADGVAPACYDGLALARDERKVPRRGT